MELKEIIDICIEYDALLVASAEFKNRMDVVTLPSFTRLAAAVRTF